MEHAAVPVPVGTSLAWNAAMQDLQLLRRDCAQKRSEYLHARELFGHARRFADDPTALRDELAAAAIAYYAAHGAFHGALRSRPLRGRPN